MVRELQDVLDRHKLERKEFLKKQKNFARKFPAKLRVSPSTVNVIYWSTNGTLASTIAF